MTRRYLVREMFLSLQGEGAMAGRAAVFCRFAGCNLWSGREEDRSRAVCRFCDTAFVGTGGVGGGVFGADELAGAMANVWHGGAAPFAVLTGGEPLLQLDSNLIRAMHRRGFEVAVETNGTLVPPVGVDWLCVSPKADAPWVCRGGDEMKVVYPQSGLDLDAAALLPFHHFWLQPMDGPSLTANTRAAIDYCLRDPRWRLSAQIHKHLEIP